MFSTFLWPAALSSGQRRWRFPTCGTLPTAAFLREPSTVSFDSAPLCFPHLRIFGSPLRRLRPSPPRVGSSGAGSGSSAAALQTFHIQLLIHCSRVALSGSTSPLSADHPSASRPSFARSALSGGSAPGVDSLGPRFSTSQHHVFFTLAPVFHIPVARGLTGFACAHPCRTLPTAAFLPRLSTPSFDFTSI